MKLNITESTPTADLVALRNALTDGPPIKKFRDRKTAIKALGDLVTATPQAKLASLPDALVLSCFTTKRIGAYAGRPSRFKGMRLFTVLKENPHRPGTDAYQSWELIAATGKAGLPYESWLKESKATTLWLRNHVNKEYITAE